MTRQLKTSSQQPREWIGSRTSNLVKIIPARSATCHYGQLTGNRNTREFKSVQWKNLTWSPNYYYYYYYKICIVHKFKRARARVTAFFLETEVAEYNGDVRILTTNSEQQFMHTCSENMTKRLQNSHRLPTIHSILDTGVSQSQGSVGIFTGSSCWMCTVKIWPKVLLNVYRSPKRAYLTGNWGHWIHRRLQKCSICTLLHYGPRN